MSDIIYQQVDENLKKAITDMAPWVEKYNCMPLTEGCYAVAAQSGDQIVGFAALKPQKWIPPLDQYYDAYIDVIEVEESHQRQGIGRRMVEMMELWAKEKGYRQIRAWSSSDKTAALHMWYALNYCMCPAAMLGKSVVPGYDNQQIVGYYYAKLLNKKA